MDTPSEGRPKVFYQRETRSLNGTVKRATPNHVESKKEKAAPPPKKQLLKVKMTRPLYKDLMAARKADEQKMQKTEQEETPADNQPSQTSRQPACELTLEKSPAKVTPSPQTIPTKQTLSPKISPSKQQPIPASEVPSSEVEVTIEQAPMIPTPIFDESKQQDTIESEISVATKSDVSQDNLNESVTTPKKATTNGDRPKLPVMSISKSMIESRDMNPGTRRTSGIIGTGKETNLFGRPRKDTLVYDENHPLTVERVVGCELHWRGLKIAAKVAERSNASDLIEHFEIWKFKNAARELHRYFSSLPSSEYIKYSRKERMKEFLNEVMNYKE